MSKSRKRRNNGVRLALIFLCVILSVILIVISGLGLYVNYLYGRMEFVGQDTTMSAEDAQDLLLGEAETIDPDSTEEVVDQDDITFLEGQVGKLEHGEHVVNIMLVGQDAREGENVQRSDTMILLSFNTSKKTITLTSIMRDQYVKIPGYGQTKLNHAYQYGGMSLMNQTLEDHFGLEIHGNVEVNFTGFEKIIDHLGGVDIKLTKAEVKYLKSKGFSYVQVGENRLPGDCALWYARLRSIDTDYARAERQRNVMMSLFEAYKDLSYTQMLSLLHELLPLIKTNMTMSDITGYAVDVYPMLAEAEVQTLRIPVDGTFKGGFVKVSEGMKLWCQYNIDFEANKAVLAEIFAEE